jgi:aspartyl-tRNA(Asn)/glutamyl-tRNA(Gln) amidotransferase subunit B
VERQIAIIESGGKVVQETRLFDPDKGETRSMRSKEEANDYRYFPDPDLLPVELDDDYIEAVRATLPELPDAKRRRFVSELGLSDKDAAGLTASKAMADYFEALLAASGCEAKLCANWVMGELSGALNRDGKGIGESPVSAELLGGMLKRIADNTISGKIAKEVFEAMWNGEGDADAIIDQKGLKQITDSGALEGIIDEILANNAAQVEGYRAAEPEKRGKMIGFFVGQVMKATGGKANPGQVNQLLKSKLEG